MIWQVPKIWEDGDVWIIGGGPSVTEQFGIPESVTKSVLSGTSTPDAYSPYMESIHNKHIIGINISFMIGNWIDFAFFGDPNFFLKYQVELAKFPGLKISCAPNTENVPWIKTLGRDGSHGKGISSNPYKVSWNGNSGAAAISVAANAGAKRIILLGFDMKLGDNKMQHWHDVYQRGPAVGDRRMKHLPFQRHLIGFAQIAKDAKSRGIEILNANPKSAIEEFKKYSVKELLYDNS